MPELPKDDLDTVIDRLYEYVRINKRVGLDAAASALGLPSAQAEKLALLLEQSKLIRVQYSLGKTELFSYEEETQVAAAKAPAQGRSLRDITNTLEHEAMSSESVLEFMERDLLRRIRLSESTIEAMEHTGSYTEEDVGFLKKEVEILDAQLAHFRSEVSQLDAIQREFEGKVREFEKRIRELEAGGAVSGREKAAAAKRGASGISSALSALSSALASAKNALLSAFGGKQKQAQPPQGAQKPEPQPEREQERPPAGAVEPAEFAKAAPSVPQQTAGEAQEAVKSVWEKPAQKTGERPAAKPSAAKRGKKRGKAKRK
ncbi:MAG: hypothetical protein WC792_00570 [Candidatus Micrarchaeia archaeon]|jgi:hypothetical protein